MQAVALARSNNDGTPPVPPWLNLEVLVRQDTIDRLGELAQEVDSVAPMILDLARRANEALVAFDTEVRSAAAGLPDGVFDVVCGLTGAERLFAAISDLGNALDPDGMWEERSEGDAPAAGSAEVTQLR